MCKDAETSYAPTNNQIQASDAYNFSQMTKMYNGDKDSETYNQNEKDADVDIDTEMKKRNKDCYQLLMNSETGSVEHKRGQLLFQ